MLEKHLSRRTSKKSIMLSLKMNGENRKKNLPAACHMKNFLEMQIRSEQQH